MLQPPPEPVHVAYSIWDLSDSYNAIAGVALISLLENTKSHVVIHLLYDEKLHTDFPAYTENYKKYLCIQERYNCEVLFHHVDAPEWLHSLPSVRYYSFGTFLRLFLPEIVPWLDKIIYLDCDICVDTDIVDLWNFDLKGKSLGVDTLKFNAGVIIMDLQKIRKEHELAKETLTFLNNHPRTKLLDQDALQHVFKDDVVFFNRLYNITTDFHDTYAEKRGIFHYTWTKPWKVWRGGECPEMTFWKYYSKTPWANFPYFVKALAECSDLSLQHANTSAERLLYYPLKYRIHYLLKFIFSFTRIHLRELKVKTLDCIRKHET